MDKNLNKPEGLSPAGVRAYDAIMTHLRSVRVNDLSTGGCKAFYSPEEWIARGEEYGKNSMLIVVYDGGDLRPFFNMDSAYDLGASYADFCTAEGHRVAKDYNPYATVENMQAALIRAGFFVEECTGWYAAVYENK